MPDVELARREGIELVRTGSWQLLSGSWNPTREDILAAVEAQNCPAVRRPRLKLGHTDERFNGDGQPALGWFENLRAADDGNTLLGDQVALPWLSAVQAAAYPDRSVEGNYRHRCALGHTHPFVITAVALLGETAPGVATLKSISDLPEMLGVAASSEVPEGAEHVQVTVRAAADDTEPEHTGAMVALIPTVEDAARLAVEGGEPADELHVTLAYLGEAADLGEAGQQDVIDAVSTAANGLPQITADLFSVNVFNPPGMTSDDGRQRDTCLVWGLSGDLIDAVHTLISEALWSVPMPEQHRPWHAHMTAIYSGDLGRIPELAGKVGPVTFDRLRLAFGGKHVDIPLIGEPEPLDAPDEVAAAAGGDDELKRYWLGDGVKRWATKKHPWTALYRQILKHVKNPEKAKRIASDWYREHFGHMPNQKVAASAGHPWDEHKHERDGDGKFANKASADNKPAGKAPPPTRLRGGNHKTVHVDINDDGAQIRIPYDGSDDDTPGDHLDTIRLDKATAAELGEEMDAMLDMRATYIKRAQAAWDRLLKAEDNEPGTAEFKAAQDAWFELGGDGQRIAGGELDGDTGALVYEMRMGDEVTDTEFLIGIRPKGVDPDEWDLQEATADAAGESLKLAGFRKLRKLLVGGAVAASAVPNLPAAEPEQEINPDPKEGLVSTELSGIRSRLGLDDTADEQTILSALDELKAKADTPVVDQEAVAASAAVAEKAKADAEAATAEKDELRKEVQILASQMKTVSDELAAAKAEKAATVKASVLDEAARLGKFTPADREQWEKDYDEAPGAVTRVLASIAPGTAVPVMASGVTGSPEPEVADDGLGVSDDALNKWAAQLGVSSEELTRG